MKRYLGFFAFLLVLLVGTYFIARKYLIIDLSPRGIISKIVPPSKNVKNLLPQGPGTPSAFFLPLGYSLDIYADLKGGLPRALAFDRHQNLLVSVPNKGTVIAILNINKGGKSDADRVVLSGLNKPHGIAVDDNYLFVAQTDKVSRFRYNPAVQTAADEEVLFTLPGGGRHSTRTIKIHDNKLYTSVGSSCDVCIEDDDYRAAILVSNLDGTDLRVFAKGLRNTVFFTFDGSGRMWGNDMGRDFLGDNLPPDELNLILEGGDYGWPYCFGQRVVDEKFDAASSILCSQTNPSSFDYPAHSAPLGIVRMGDSFLVAFHGSRNSSSPVGYKVVKVDTIGGEVIGMDNYITGFINEGEVLGRPVDLIFDSKGRLYISDDHSGVIYVLYK